MAKQDRKNPPSGDTVYRAIPLPGIDIGLSRNSRRIRIKARKKSAVFVAAFFVLPWVLLACGYFVYVRGQGQKSAAVARKMCQPGPWGQVELFDFVTDPPSDFITLDLFPPLRPEWLFRGLSRNDVAALFEKAQVPPTLSERLLVSIHQVDNVGTQVLPSDDALLELAPAARAAIYQELIKAPENSAQRDPFIFVSGKLDDWLAQTQCSAKTIELVHKLLYPHQDHVLLADTPSLMRLIPDTAEKLRLLTALLRRQTTLARLLFDERSDIAGLASYWGAGGRVSRIRTTLESFKDVKGTEGFTIVHFLPPFAREHVYHYPASADAGSKQRDCHWTSLNFFNEIPDDRFIDPARVREAFVNDLSAISEAPAFGDIAAFVRKSDGNIIHSCVHIADDLYFTKNGPSQISPWVLMHLNDILAMFPAHGELDVRHYRRKGS